MTLFLFAVISNILIGWYNLIRSNKQASNGEYSQANWSFGCAILNIMLAISLIACSIYLTGTS